MKHFAQGKAGLNTKEPLVSVVVPVYRVKEQILRDCIDSIRSQDYENLEIILIDDGSPDSCGEICDDCAKLDSRISVIHQENKGTGAARNTGIVAMTGEYVAFVDNDDLLPSCFVSVTLDAARTSGYDIVSVATNIFTEGHYQPQAVTETVEISKKDMLELMLYQTKQGFDTCVFGRLYRSSLFEHLRFHEGLYYEDLGAMYKLILLSTKMGICETGLYGYRGDSQGTMNAPINKGKLKSRVVGDWLVQDISRQIPELKNAAVSRKLSFLFSLFVRIPLGDERYREDATSIWDEIKKHRKQVLLDAKARGKTRAACFISYFGPRVLNASFKLFDR